MQNEKNTFKVLGPDGKETEYEILFTFESDETKKHYIIYTDMTSNPRVFASIYNPNEENTNLVPIETEKEWELISNILEKLKIQAKEKLNETDE